MRILHSYCLNYNIGDYALGIGVKNLFRQNFSVDFFGETNLQGQVFNEYYINEVVNKRYDLLLIGGGGIIHGAHWPNGWFWLIEKELIKTIRIPFVIFAVGNNYFHSEGEMPQKAIDHLNETSRYAKYFSVRNDGSYERVINALNFTPVEQPDPGFHIPKAENPFSVFKEKYAIVQLAADKISCRLGNSDNVISFKKNLIDNLRKVAKDFRLLFIPHVFDDWKFSQEIANEIPHSYCLNFGAYAFDKAQKVIELYQNASFVIAMRGHAQIIPIGFEVPVISLYNHEKHYGLMKKLGLADYGLKISNPEFENTFGKIYGLLLSNYNGYKEQLSTIRKTLNRQTEAAFSIMKAVL